VEDKEPIMKFLKHLLKDEYGGESIEMALVVSTVAIGTLASYKSVTSSLDTGLTNITTGIADGTSNGEGG
tara:strand:- start:191 stop:400 length:210 start_codon:yes stop_codon:yes gene_type:complete